MRAEGTAGKDDFVDDKGVAIVNRSQVDWGWRRTTARSVLWKLDTNWDMKLHFGLLLVDIDDFRGPSYVSSEPLPARFGVFHRCGGGVGRDRGSDGGMLQTRRRLGRPTRGPSPLGDAPTPIMNRGDSERQAMPLIAQGPSPCGPAAVVGQLVAVAR